MVHPSLLLNYHIMLNYQQLRLGTIISWAHDPTKNKQKQTKLNKIKKIKNLKQEWLLAIWNKIQTHQRRCPTNMLPSTGQQLNQTEGKLFPFSFFIIFNRLTVTRRFVGRWRGLPQKFAVCVSNSMSINKHWIFMCLDLKKIKTKFNMYTHTQLHRRAEITEPFHDLHWCLYILHTLLFLVPSTLLANTPTIRHPHLNPQSVWQWLDQITCGITIQLQKLSKQEGYSSAFCRCLKTHLLSKWLTHSALSVLMLTTIVVQWPSQFF